MTAVSSSNHTGANSAHSLAEAMRAGLEKRWLIPPSPECVDFPGLLSRDQLLRFGDLLHHSPTATGRLAPVVRLLRRILRTLLKPWLNMQSCCNAGLIDAVEALHLAVFARFADLHNQLEQRCRILHDLIQQQTALHTALNEHWAALENKGKQAVCIAESEGVQPIFVCCSTATADPGWAASTDDISAVALVAARKA